jgi:hypothetical protein
MLDLFQMSLTYVCPLAKSLDALVGRSWRIQEIVMFDFENETHVQSAKT